MIRICPQPGCPNTAPCDTHRQTWTPDTHRGTSTERGYGTPWRQLRRTILDRDGHACRWILETGDHCGAPARNVDHITPKAAGGNDTPPNLRALCDHHAQRKDANDAAEGRRRAARARRYAREGRGSPPAPEAQGPMGAAARSAYEIENAEPIASGDTPEIVIERTEEAQRRFRRLVRPASPLEPQPPVELPGCQTIDKLPDAEQNRTDNGTVWTPVELPTVPLDEDEAA